MKKFVLFTLTAVLCTALLGCQNQKEAELTVEAGDLELLDVICSYEGVPRSYGSEFVINIKNDDGWIPFSSGESYTVQYEKATIDGNKKEDKSLKITIVDTVAPVIFQQQGSDKSTPVVPYSEDEKVLERSILNAISARFAVADNTSTSPIKICAENTTIIQVDNTLLESPQVITFTFSDPSGNKAEGTIELIISKESK